MSTSAVRMPARTPAESSHTSVTWLLRPSENNWMVSSASAVSTPPSSGTLMCQMYLPGIHPHAQHEQKALQHILAEVCQLAHDVHGQAGQGPGMAQTAQDAACIPSTRLLDTVDTEAIFMELEKMNTMQPMRAKGKDHPPCDDPRRSALALYVPHPQPRALMLCSMLASLSWLLASFGGSLPPEPPGHVPRTWDCSAGSQTWPALFPPLPFPCSGGPALSRGR